MAKIALVRCFDRLIDVPCLALKHIIKAAGHEVRIVNDTGGAVDIGLHPEQFRRRFETLLDRSFGIAVLIAHQQCHHVRVHQSRPADVDEDVFLDSALVGGAAELNKFFPELKCYSFRVDTKDALLGIKAVHPISREDKAFLMKCISAWGEQLFHQPELEEDPPLRFAYPLRS